MCYLPPLGGFKRISAFDHPHKPEQRKIVRVLCKSAHATNQPPICTTLLSSDLLACFLLLVTYPIINSLTPTSPTITPNSKFHRWILFVSHPCLFFTLLAFSCRFFTLFLFSTRSWRCSLRCYCRLDGNYFISLWAFEVIRMAITSSLCW